MKQKRSAREDSLLQKKSFEIVFGGMKDEKDKKALKLAGLAIVLLVLAAEGILVYHINSHAMQNVVTVGNVNIRLTEPEYERQRDEEESESETGQAIVVENVKPGEKILRDPTIVVEEGSQTAYLRTRIVVKGLTEYQKTIS